MNVDGVFQNLRQKLDVLGYTQPLPLASISLVGSLFEDLVKTTESLRDSKAKIVSLLEEKSCWELGVEPYKCDNSRLLAECNQLHLQLIKHREEQDQRNCEYNQKIRNLQSDKLHLEEHCQQLQKDIQTLISKYSDSAKTKKDGSTMSKKPFVSTVRCDERLPMPLSEQNINNQIRCTKCNAGYYQKLSAGGSAGALSIGKQQVELDRLENSLKDLSEQLSCYKRKVEARDREIRRLNDLLTGGRPPAALAKDCCYKDIGTLSEDVELLQREKSEALCKIREYQDNMHEAMQRAMDLEGRNKKLQKELDGLKEAALSVESQANTEIAEREKEINELKKEVQDFKSKWNVDGNSRIASGSISSSKTSASEDKRKINERLNELTQRESELSCENERLHKKNQKLKSKINSLQKEIEQKSLKEENRIDEERIRLKSERDFFQKEYLRLVGKAGSEKEIEFLQSQINSKDDELRILRSELCLRQQQQPHPPQSARTEKSSSTYSDCVQAIILRAERERDCVKTELERVRSERDTLREKHRSIIQLQLEESHKYHEKINDLNEQLRQLEANNRDLNSARLPGQTQIVLFKEEIEELKRRLFSLQEENCQVKSNHNQLKMLHDRTERLLSEYQNKLTVAENQLQNAEARLTTVGSARDSTRDEVATLRNEVASLKSTYVSLENEKDKIVTQLDTKTERVYKLEYELKACKDKRIDLEKQVEKLEKKLENITFKNRERDSELHETSTESKTLRQQLAALKLSREVAMEENGRLSNELAESQAEIITLKRKLKDSEMEIERLKQQLKKYVQEVKKAEDLLTHKEKERDEMLDHYRSLSHDAVLLEGSNHSLEAEAAEYKRQIGELEVEIDALKKELCCRNNAIEQLENKLTNLSTQNTCLERQLEEAYDDQRLLKVDLSARQELCDKLDIQKDKLNAELAEVNEIRKKLERDNEKLRAENYKNTIGIKASSDTMTELLNKTRRELEEQIQIDSKLSQEIVSIKKRNEDLLKELDEEREKRHQHELLAHEYEVQNQELRHNITDERFRHARSREQSPRFPLL